MISKYSKIFQNCRNFPRFSLRSATDANPLPPLPTSIWRFSWAKSICDASLMTGTHCIALSLQTIHVWLAVSIEKPNFDYSSQTKIGCIEWCLSYMSFHVDASKLKLKRYSSRIFLLANVKRAPSPIFHISFLLKSNWNINLSPPGVFKI